GCALVKKRIYCFGGTIALPVEDSPKTDYNLQATNDHIYLDLNPLDTLSTTTNTRTSIPLEWKHVTNIYNGQVLQPRTYLGSAALDDEDSYVLYGGWQGQSGANVTHFRNLNYPFLKYDTRSDSWSSLPLSSDYIYTTASYFVNLGDRLWIWGGQRNSTTYTAPNILRQYDYKSKLWTINEVSKDWWMRIDHTATLALDGNIYIIGGAFQTDQPNSFTMAPLDKIIVYHTQTSQWSFVNTTGILPTPRVAHTTNLIPNTNYLLIYGGRTLKDNSFTNCDDICYLYDVTKNDYSTCNLPDVKHRYGHFATIYNKKYLLFIFGFTTKNIGADSINILDVSDPLKLTWVPANLAIKDDSVYPLPVPVVIVISAVIIILGLILIGIMIYFFKFYLKKKNIDCEKYIDKNDTTSDNDITLNEQKSTTLIKS
ncbi:hypothetical protein BJ944DRAFT_280285, partial [Cunninghamella echinulata]